MFSLFFRFSLLLLFSYASVFAMAEDKTKHIQACMVISYAGETILHKYRKKPHISNIFYASGISFFVGLTKELYDENDYGGFSSKDLAADAIGAFSGAVLSHYLNKNYFLRIEHDTKKKKSKIVGEYKF